MTNDTYQLIKNNSIRKFEEKAKIVNIMYDSGFVYRSEALFLSDPRIFIDLLNSGATNLETSFDEDSETYKHLAVFKDQKIKTYCDIKIGEI